MRSIRGKNSIYKVVKKLGSGGFAEVLLAMDRDGLVVIKLPKEGELANRLIREEAAILEEISKPIPHDNIVSFIEWIPDMSALIEEYIPGHTLGRAFSNRRATQNDAIRIALGILSALEKIHSLGVVHGDIKPDNIILPKPLHPVLIDLGIARAFGEKSMAGTPGWSAPEFMKGEVSPEADIYSVGVILLFLISGIDPANSIGPQDIPRNISDHLKQVLKRALSSNPWERFSSAREMALALMGAKIPVRNVPRIVIQGKTIPLSNKMTFGRVKRQGGTGKADINLQEIGSRRALPPGPPVGWAEIVRVGTEYWISDKGIPGGLWVYEGSTWRKVLDYPLKHGQLISLGMRRRGGYLLPYVPARVYLR